MKFFATGKLGKVTKRNNNYVSFGVAEPSYKQGDEYVTPWVNFLVKEDGPLGKFLVANGEKIDVVMVSGTERESRNADNNTVYFHNVTSIDVITWKKQESDNESGDEKYPWEE